MKIEDFDKFQHFNANENWGNIEQLQWWHVLHLESIREETGWPMKIHCSCERKGHSKKSYHPRGCATDFHFISPIELSVQYDILKTALVGFGSWPFVGLGVYPEWANPGFHIDGRGYGLRWVRANGIDYYGEENVIQLLSDYEVLKSKVKIGDSF